ncbi:hypothetical protein H0H92_001951 [Tricholoma furcatifolium]|nr:hypothetical protein H0H92_001951 [Tricholoma furcatifolium]
MRTTRSSSRKLAQASNGNASTVAESEGKRKLDEEVPKTQPKKRARLPKSTTNEDAGQAQPTPPEPSSSTAIPNIPDSQIAHPTVPAVLTFSFEEGKRHLISVDHRFRDLFSKMQCKPYEHLEMVHPFRGQQISWLAARSVNHKFVRLFDPSIPEKIDEYPAHGKPTSFYPTPEMVANTDIPTLRTAGLSQRKAEYVLDLAQRFADGRLSTENLVKANDEELAKMLIEVRGIGRWTGDLGVQRGLVVWFLSLHSPKHNWGWTPQKVGNTTTSSKKGKSKGKNEAADSDALPVVEENTATSSNVVNIEEAPTPDISSVPPVADEEGVDDLASLPPAFTPSIKNTLKKPGVDEGSEPIPLPTGLTVEVLKSRLSGKNKVKWAPFIAFFRTKQSLDDGWQVSTTCGL